MSVPVEKLTPMLRQYVEFKAERPDVILLMRVGDFYEAYGEDAEIIARELHITLTGTLVQFGRRCGGRFVADSGVA